MKKKKSFPDLNKDGKITKADVLKGRGVFKTGGRAAEMKETAMKRAKVKEQLFGANQRAVSNDMKQRFEEAKRKDQDRSYEKKYDISREEARTIARTKKAMGGPVEVKADDSVDTYGNPKGKKKSIQIQGWGKARH